MDEKEVRLLYLSNNKEPRESITWIENAQSGIVSKMMLFPLKPEKQFPLRLNKVIVGSKSPEPEAIARQFAYMISQEWRDYPVITTDVSKITDYR